MELADLIEPEAELRLLGNGYQFTEGPVWVASQNCLEFVDIPSDTRWRWTCRRGCAVLRRSRLLLVRLLEARVARPSRWTLPITALRVTSPSCAAI